MEIIIFVVVDKNTATFTSDWSLPLTLEEAVFAFGVKNHNQNARPLESNQDWTGAMIFLNILVIVTLLFKKM